MSREQMISVVDQLQAGLRDNRAGAVAQSKRLLHGIVDRSSPALLSTLLPALPALPALLPTIWTASSDHALNCSTA